MSLSLSLRDFEEGRERIAVVGLGYVGLPLAVLLARKFRVVGFDVDRTRIEELKRNIDRTGEVDLSRRGAEVEWTWKEDKLGECRLIIVAVPTPVDKLNDPDLKFLEAASDTVGRNLSRGSVVVYESTVWPGLTEEVCVPILEKASGLRWRKDFHVGYSPERVNPGDREHTIEKIVKVVAGDSPEVAAFLAGIYGAVIEAGVHVAPNIKVAEAAKVIENIQRDVNIALMNELALIFHRLGIDTREVLEAAATKWNFLPFEPGLVGGHCIGVDPYYLARKAREAGYIPELILAGRRINELIPEYVAQELIKALIKNDKKVKGGRVLILGFSFKENVPDVRNTKVYNIFKALKEYGLEVLVFDPIADKETAHREYGINFIENPENYAPFEAILVAVRHSFFKENFKLDRISLLLNYPGILFDVRGLYDRKEAIEKGLFYWRL
ncbi:nucleotide sugar dehydrogenase [Thermosulfurimonas sp. F29]|uniref:nucleotide sugar dehydrogenase n=1 Tax=Thermosulfurimonas sp. F29 TaxID=2867247 RepID=UPI00351D5E33